MLLSSDLRLLLATFGLVLIAATGRAALADETANLQVTAQVDASCTLTGGTLAFGTYTATAIEPTESDADIGYSCAPGTNIILSLDAGGQAQGENRGMAGPGGATLAYQLYKDDARSQVWGIGPANGVTISGTPGTPQTVPVYGAIGPGQQTAAGAYTDTVLITLVVSP